jgi:hypothetical protein
MDGFAGPDQEASATDRNGFRGPQTVITCGTLLVAIVVHLVSIPTSRLPHAAKLRREQRHRAALTGVLGAVLLFEAYAAAFDLNSWWEWTVFAGFAATAVGAAVAVQTRLR